ncbi:hypothetical protein R3W88_016501 [Solanum pinnatisectum]|uniref:Uncharacterized protein n=1 Tax=Solanum pinnatisectum TaxID=50273 RepID=A0AAV9KXQ5_9SOLN|nr:hypothetical protein R3W88_016501 [Solanum pinnatisectum]
MLASGKVLGNKQSRQEWMARGRNKYKRDKNDIEGVMHYLDENSFEALREDKQMAKIKDIEQMVENKDTKKHQSDEQDELIQYTQEEEDNRRIDEGRDDKKNEGALVVYERRDEEVLPLSIRNDNL